jgi:hypothetical protein
MDFIGSDWFKRLCDRYESAGYRFVLNINNLEVQFVPKEYGVNYILGGFELARNVVLFRATMDWYREAKNLDKMNAILLSELSNILEAQDEFPQHQQIIDSFED